MDRINNNSRIKDERLRRIVRESLLNEALLDEDNWFGRNFIPMSKSWKQDSIMKRIGKAAIENWKKKSERGCIGEIKFSKVISVWMHLVYEKGANGSENYKCFTNEEGLKKSLINFVNNLAVQEYNRLAPMGKYSNEYLAYELNCTPQGCPLVKKGINVPQNQKDSFSATNAAKGILKWAWNHKKIIAVAALGLFIFKKCNNFSNMVDNAINSIPSTGISLQTKDGQKINVPKQDIINAQRNISLDSLKKAYQAADVFEENTAFQIKSGIEEIATK